MAPAHSQRGVSGRMSTLPDMTASLVNLPAPRPPTAWAGRAGAWHPCLSALPGKGRCPQPHGPFKRSGPHEHASGGNVKHEKVNPSL